MRCECGREHFFTGVLAIIGLLALVNVVLSRLGW